MTTPQELDKKIKELRQSLINFNKPIVKPKTPEELSVVIDELRQQQTQRYIVKPKTPEELSVVINELQQQINII